MSKVTVLIYARTHFYINTYILTRHSGEIMKVFFFGCGNMVFQRNLFDILLLLLSVILSELNEIQSSKT